MPSPSQSRQIETGKTATLFARFGSVLAELTVTWLVTNPDWSGFVVNRISKLLPAGRLETAQETIPFERDTRISAADAAATHSSCAGIIALTWTASAVAGPALLTWTEYRKLLM